jgi:general secretion pathway protein A
VGAAIGVQQVRELTSSVASLRSNQEQMSQYAEDLVAEKEQLQSQVAALLQEKREREQQVLSFLPSTIKPTDKNQAFKQLGSSWAIDYNQELDGEFCDYVRSFDKQCETEFGDWSNLNQLDRPAILHMTAMNGETVYGVLEQVSEQQVIVVFNGEAFRLSKQQVASVWNGTFSYLWNVPPGYQEPLRLDMRGQAVQWLKTNLAKLDNLDLIVPPDVPYDLDLQFQVLKFQQKYGLKADAVAGPATLIALNSLVSTDHPTLAWRGES